MNLRTHRGVVGLVLKSAIATSQINKKIFNYLTKENLIISIKDFINRKKIFAIDSRERFCYLLLGNSGNKKFSVVMNLNSVIDLTMNNKNIEITHQDLKILNPFTGMLPNISTKSEADFAFKNS